MVAMDALEFWSSSLPSHVMLPFYPKILPCLDSFLKTTDQGMLYASHKIANKFVN